MGALLDEIISDLRYIETEMENQVFTWRGAEYICIPNTANEEKDLGTGGFNIGADFVMSVRVNQFGNVLPKEQDLITYLGKEYRIRQVGVTALNAYIRLHCVSDTRGI